jgi:uncharacterized protein (DUF4415 family)
METRRPINPSDWVDPDDAPSLDSDWFERAEIKRGDTVLRAGRPIGRPKSDAPKQAVNIRLDADLLAHFRATGPGWQSRINALLRKSMKEI